MKVYLEVTQMICIFFSVICIAIGGIALDGVFYSTAIQVVFIGVIALIGAMVIGFLKGDDV